MAERVLPPDSGDGDEPNNSQIQPAVSLPKQNNQFAAFRSGTYVVQVPKDQVYRVPNAENAIIAEQRRKQSHDRKSKPCCSCCCCVGSVIVIILVLLGLAVGLSFIFLKYKDPKFSVEDLAAVNGSNSNTKDLRPEYRLTLKALNSNKRVGILYKEGGVVSLSFRKQEIAVGKYPSFFHDHKKTTTLNLVLHGSNVALPKEIENSMKSEKSKVHILFSLKMNLPARTKVWNFKTGNKEFGVDCNVMVDTLAKGTRVLSQECSTKGKH